MSAPYSLTFRLEHLEPIRRGIKTCTVRLARRPRLEAGRELALRFGRRDAPTIVRAVCREVVALDLAPHLETLYEVRTAEDAGEVAYDAVNGEPSAAELEVMSSEDTLAYIATDPAHDRELVRALRASGGDYTALVLEADRRETASAFAVYFEVRP